MGGSRGDSGPVSPANRRAGDGGLTAVARHAILAVGLLGALLVLVAEFTTLFQVHIATATAPIKSVSAGSHHTYALVPLALLSAVLAHAFWRAASRPALLAIGLLGIVVLLIALLGDLPDAHATGLALSAGHYVEASATPSAGMYMETLGAVVLVITCVCGFMLIGPPPRAARP